MRHSCFKFLTAFLWLFLIGKPAAHATHIVGADFTYRLLNAATRDYEFRLSLYQDCLAGEPAAIVEDNPAKIRIYRQTNGGTELLDAQRITWRPGDPEQVPLNFDNACLVNPPATCLKRSIFIGRIRLPDSDPNASYIIAYQRCCRNAQVNNIANPDATGATYYATIPPLNVGENNSAIFKNNPPQIICVNTPLNYDNSATDADGDSLSYELCEAFQGGDPSSSGAAPDPLPPPYQQVRYISGYSPRNPFPSNPRLQIDPTTGILTAKPTMQGRFVVTVCCNEWRNGVKINTTKREFQFVVTNCSRAVVADIPQYSSEINTYVVQCNSYTVKFDNLSTGGFQYDWDFGVLNSTTDVSNQFSPTFTYPDTGTYVVKLVVNRGSTCSDSITRYVRVYPNFKADFTTSGLYCPDVPVQFTDQSISSYGAVSFWNWNMNDGNTYSVANPAHFFGEGGDYKVTLISGNALGCRDTVSKVVNIERFRPFAGNDTTVVKGESFPLQASGGQTYAWTPGSFLSNVNIPSPTATFPQSGIYKYTVNVTSASGCKGSDEVAITVVEKPTLVVPTAFTPNGDGLNDYLAPIVAGYREINFFRIFNRWGELVFETTRFGNGWDGYYKDRIAEIGTYFWVLSTVDRYGKKEISKGDVQLLR